MANPPSGKDGGKMRLNRDNVNKRIYCCSNCNELQSLCLQEIRQLDALRARLAEVEAERDATRAEAEAYWRCFHCGFSTKDEKEAEAHFGDRDEEMALCVWWKESTDLERVQALQDALQEAATAQAEVAAVEIEKLEREFYAIAESHESPDTRTMAIAYNFAARYLSDRAAALRAGATGGSDGR